jgi:hypothetical protein
VFKALTREDMNDSSSNPSRITIGERIYEKLEPVLEKIKNISNFRVRIITLTFSNMIGIMFLVYDTAHSGKNLTHFGGNYC